METIRSSNQSFLISSIYQTAKDQNAVSYVTNYAFDRSVAPCGIDYGNEVSVSVGSSNGGFSNSYTLDVPRLGFSNSGHIKFTVKVIPATTNGTWLNVMTGALKNTLFGMLERIETLELRTKKEVLYRHNSASLISWLESLPNEVQREAYRLVMCQGVDTEGDAVAGTITHTTGAGGEATFYIPLAVFPPFYESTQSIDLDYSEPCQIKITFGAQDLKRVIATNGTYANAVAGHLQGNLTLNTSALVYDADARNSILQAYDKADGGKIQKMSYDYYINNNIGTKNQPIKLEGMKNVLSLFVFVKKTKTDDAAGADLYNLVPIKKIRLTSGNKTILEFDGVETKILAFRNFKGGNALYKDTFVYELNFSLKDHTLVGNSFGGALSIENLVDPRLIVDHTDDNDADNTHEVFVVAKQLNVLHMLTSNGSLSLGANN